MQDKTKKLLVKMQAREDADSLRRGRRLIKAIRGIGSNFYEHELHQIEQLVESAYGRGRLNGHIR